MSRTGPPPPVTPTSCSRRPRRWSGTTSAPPRNDPLPGGDAPGAAPSARPATITPSSPLAERWACGRPSPRVGLPRQWLRHLYDTCASGCWRRVRRPDFDAFWAAGDTGCRRPGDGSCCAIPRRPRAAAAAHAEREDGDRLRRIAGFGYDDCPAIRRGWSPPSGWAARWREPSRCICSPTSRRRGCTASSISAPPAWRRRWRGGSRCGCTPPDAAARGIADGDVVRVFNHRGACLAGAVISDAVRAGAWCSCHRRLVRPARPGAGRPAVRARQPERADGRRADLAAGSGMHRASTRWSTWNAGPRAAAGDHRRPAADPAAGEPARRATGPG